MTDNDSDAGRLQDRQAARQESWADRQHINRPIPHKIKSTEGCKHSESNSFSTRTGDSDASCISAAPPAAAPSRRSSAAVAVARTRS